MKDLKTTILENMSPKISWDDFLKTCQSYLERKNDHINMYDVFDLPPRSRKGLPKVLPTTLKAASDRKFSKFTKETIKDCIGKNVRAFICAGESNWILIEMCSPLPGGIAGFPVADMDMLIKTIGEDNVVKIYNFMKEN